METVGEIAAVTFVEEWLPRDGEDVGEWLSECGTEKECDDDFVLASLIVKLFETRMVSLAFDDWVAE